MTSKERLEALYREQFAPVKRDIAQSFGLTVEDMDRSNAPPAPQARGVFWAYLFALGWSYSRIGRLVGRDHSTVSDGVKKWGASRAA